MASATIGGLIKDYRIKKRISQLDISLAVGWKGTSRLSKIEQGRSGKPSREVIDKIIDALQLTESEKGDFLLNGGYLPTDSEITHIIQKVKPLIDDWKHASFMIDLSWRVLYANSHAYELFQVPRQFDLLAAKATMLDFVFSKDIQIPVQLHSSSKYSKIMTYKESMVAQFKIEHKGFENEFWYKTMIRRLIKSEEFRRVWSTIQPEYIDRLLLDYEPLVVADEKTGKSFDFHVFTPRVTIDPRFQVVLYLPKN